MQRAIERRGIPTVSVTAARDVTERAKPPRALFVPFTMGHHFGVPFHRELQPWVLTAALERLEFAERSGDIAMIPVTWSEARRQGDAIERDLEPKR